MTKGIMQDGEVAALAAVVPEGTDRYVALLTAMPTVADGSDAVEVSDANYARGACATWFNGTLTAGSDVLSIRGNNAQIEIGSGFSAPVSGVVGWAIYDAQSSGNMLVCNDLLDAAYPNGNPVTVDYAVGDVPYFAVGDLILGLG